MRFSLLFMVICFLHLPAATAQEDRCLYLDGNGSLVRIARHASLEPTQAFTVELWIRGEGANTHGRIVRKAEYSGDGYMISWNTWNRAISGIVAHQGYSYQVWDDRANDERLKIWIHLAMTASVGGQVHLYVNGIDLDQQSAPLSPLQHSDDLIVGGFLYQTIPTEEFVGHVDELRFWNVERSQAEIQQFMNQTLEWSPGLVSAWHFDGDVLDGISANDGQLFGTVAFEPSPLQLEPAVKPSATTGSWRGGETMEIEGLLPPFTSPPLVYFGQALATQVAIVAPDRLRLLTPPGIPGDEVDIVLEGSGYRFKVLRPFRYTPFLDAPASVAPGEALWIGVEFSPPATICAFMGIPPLIQVPIPGLAGELAITPPFVDLFRVTFPLRSLRFPIDLPDDPALSGAQLLFQSLALNSLLPLDGAFTNPIEVSIR